MENIRKKEMNPIQRAN